MLLLPKIIYRFDVPPIKIAMIFSELELILKFMKDHKKS